jgi:VanZ family protein
MRKGNALPMALKQLRWLPALAWTFGILLLLLTPGIEVPKTFLGDITDKAGHAAMFAIGTLLWFLPRLLARQHMIFSQSSTRLIVVWLLVFAMATEIAQRYVPGRSGTLEDFLADAVGIAVGLIIIRVGISRTNG